MFAARSIGMDASNGDKQILAVSRPDWFNLPAVAGDSARPGGAGAEPGGRFDGKAEE